MIDNTKLICYNGNSKSPVITAIYRLLNDDETIHEENNLSARIIAKAEERGYSNEEIISDGRGIQQKDRYANFSRDVDYAEYAQHIVRFLKLI